MIFPEQARMFGICSSCGHGGNCLINEDRILNWSVRERHKEDGNDKAEENL